MELFFLKLLNMSINSCYLIVAIIVFRAIFKNVPKRFNVFLWGLVGLRLILPFSFNSTLSLLPSNEAVPEEILTSRAPVINTGITFVNHAVNPVISEGLAPLENLETTPVFNITRLVSFVWIIGTLVILLYGIISYLILKKRVAPSVYNGSSYICDSIKAPFILGIFKPRIYIPSDTEGESVEYILAHERSHIKTLDHVTKLLAFVLLAVYWYNPLVWISFVLFSKDIEMACDERVVKNRGTDYKKLYSAALLNASTKRRFYVVSPLAFGEVGVKNRIKRILSYKRPKALIVAVSLLAIITISVCFMTNPKNNTPTRASIVLDKGTDLSDVTIELLNYDFKSESPYIEIEYKSEYKNVLTFGDSFSLYRKVDGEWVDTAIGEKFFFAIGYPVAKGGSFIKKYSLSGYDMTSPGIYRLETYAVIDETLLSAEEKIGGKCYAYIEFELKEGIGNSKSIPVNSNVTLVYDNSLEPLYSPSIYLNTISRTFTFYWSMLSSYFAQGEFELDHYELVLKTNDNFNNVYVFNRTSEGFVFDASRSSTIPGYSYSSDSEAVSPVPDGALFKADNPLLLSSTVYDTATADLDGDGIIEKYSLNYGITSGLFTFLLDVVEGDFELRQMYYSDYVEPRFIVLNNGGLNISAQTQTDAVYLWTVKFDGKTLDIPELSKEKDEAPSSVKVNYASVTEVQDTYIVVSEGEDGYIHTNNPELATEELFMFFVDDATLFSVGDKVKVVHTGDFSKDTLLPSQVPLLVSKE